MHAVGNKKLNYRSQTAWRV